MNIWLISGYAGSGKTTAGTILAKSLPNSQITAFAKRVKDDVAKQYNLDRELLETQEGKASKIHQKTVRDILIEYSAQHKLDTNNPGIWADYVKDEMYENPEIKNWIIHDWRYIAEYQTMLTIPNTHIITVRIINDSIVASNSPSEHELDNVITDEIIYNNDSYDTLEIAIIRGLSLREPLWNSLQ